MPSTGNLLSSHQRRVLLIVTDETSNINNGNIRVLLVALLSPHPAQDVAVPPDEATPSARLRVVVLDPCGALAGVARLDATVSRDALQPVRLLAARRRS